MSEADVSLGEWALQLADQPAQWRVLLFFCGWPGPGQPDQVFVRDEATKVRNTIFGERGIPDEHAELDVVVPCSPGHIGRGNEDALGVGDNQFGMKLPAIFGTHGPRIVVHAWTPRAGPPLPGSIGELSYNPSIRALIALVAWHVKDQICS